MGYYTSYKLDIENITDDAEKLNIIDDLRQNTDEASWALESNGTSGDTCKWYDHEEDILAVSKKYPEKLFVLSGSGEESGDIWKFYAQNGKGAKYQAEITVPNFNPKDLK